MNRPDDVPDRQLTLTRVVRAWRNGENMHVPAELLESASPGLRLALTGLARRQRYQPQAATSNPKAPALLRTPPMTLGSSSLRQVAGLIHPGSSKP